MSYSFILIFANTYIYRTNEKIFFSGDFLTVILYWITNDQELECSASYKLLQLVNLVKSNVLHTIS